MERTRARRPLGRPFGWLWAAYAASTFGTWLAFDAFALIAILVLHAAPAEVSLLAAAGPAVGAVLAVPLGPWMEFRRKRSVMVALDLIRCVVVLSVPVAFAVGLLSLVQLLVVAVVVAAADIGFRAAGGACLKALVPPEDLLVANSRFESTTWTATMLGPPIGGAAIGMFGPVTTVVANAASYLLSAAGVRAAGGREPRPAPADRTRGAGLLEGWRHILERPPLRSMFANTVLVNGLILAASPLMAILMLGRLGFAPWQYGLAFGAPCAGGLIGSRLAPELVAVFGRHAVLRTVGTLRVCWPVGLAFVVPGTAGLVLVLGVQFGLVTCMGVFNPVFATYRLEHTDDDRVGRTLAAWSVSNTTAVAVLTALGGLLAGVSGPRAAVATAGVLLLATPVLLPRRGQGLSAPAGRSGACPRRPRRSRAPGSRCPPGGTSGCSTRPCR